MGDQPAARKLVPSNSFFVAYSIRNDTPPDPGAPDYRQELYWSFQNTGTPVLSQQQFGQTFVDAEPNENWYQHPFNEAFYNLVYKGLAKSGRCYGMCLEAQRRSGPHLAVLGAVK